MPGLVHRYPDRVLFLATGFCSTYCRYCTRSRMVGGGGEYTLQPGTVGSALDYIAAHPEIRDVLLSGGDPLTIADDRLDWLLSRLRAIPHVEFVRIGTKVPVVLPQRITRDAGRACCSRYHPLWMSIHFTHPDELTPEVAESTRAAGRRRHPARQPDGAAARHQRRRRHHEAVVHGLLKLRVKPYYLYQCDPITGSSHFRTPVETGLEIIQGLRGHTTGYAVPHLRHRRAGRRRQDPAAAGLRRGTRRRRPAAAQLRRPALPLSRSRPGMRIGLTYDALADWQGEGLDAEQLAEFDAEADGRGDRRAVSPRAATRSSGSAVRRR